HLAPGEANTYRLQIWVQAMDVVRPTMALTFVVDTSGSIVGEGLLREQAAIRAIAGHLKSGDHVNFVIWSNKDSELLKAHVISGPNDPALMDLANKLVPGGGSDLHAGLLHGYDLANTTKATDRLSRVVLISDGGANLGAIDQGTIKQEAANGDDQGI